MRSYLFTICDNYIGFDWIVSVPCSFLLYSREMYTFVSVCTVECNWWLLLRYYPKKSQPLARLGVQWCWQAVQEWQLQEIQMYLINLLIWPIPKLHFDILLQEISINYIPVFKVYYSINMVCSPLQKMNYF